MLTLTNQNSGTRTTSIKASAFPAIDASNNVIRSLRDYVYHPSFSSTRIEEDLFKENDAAHPLPTWTAFWQLSEDSPHPQGHFKALSAADEKRLFLRFNYARYRLCRLASKQRPGRTLSVTREMILWNERAEKARSELVQANMALVLAMAKRFQIPNVEFEELVSEGNMALLRCINKFDVSLGFKFSTYACRAILKSFHRISTKTAMYRQHFPVNFEPDLERPDSDARKHDIEWQDSVACLRQMFTRNKMELSEVEQAIVTERFALVSREKGKTFAEIGKQVGLSTERVRQILNQALEKIRLSMDTDAMLRKSADEALATTFGNNLRLHPPTETLPANCA